MPTYNIFHTSPPYKMPLPLPYLSRKSLLRYELVPFEIKLETVVS